MQDVAYLLEGGMGLGEDSPMRRIVPLAAVLIATGVSLGACAAAPTVGQTTPPTPFAGMILKLQLFGRSSGWATGVKPSGDAALLTTRDGGRTWSLRTPRQLATVQRLSMDPSSPSAAWIATVSRKGRVEACHTESAGRDWRCHYVTSPTSGTDLSLWPSQVDFVSPSTGWIELQQLTGRVSARAELWQTRDGGRTWHELFPLSYQGFGAAGPLTFSSANAGIHVVGYAYGYGNGVGAPGVYETTDGGRSWTVRYPPGQLSREDQQALPSHGMQAVTDEARLWILRGEHVSPGLKLYDPLVDFYGAGRVVAATGLASGPRDEALYFSDDAGQNWSRVSFAGSAIPNYFGPNWSYYLYQIDFVSPRVGFLLLNQEQVLKSLVFRTLDGGRSWSLVSGPDSAIPGAP